MDFLPVNPWTIGAACVVGVVFFAWFFSHWQQIHAKIGNLFGTRVNKELDRESADFLAFVAKAHAVVDQAAAAKKAAIDAIAKTVNAPPAPPAA